MADSSLGYDPRVCPARKDDLMQLNSHGPSLAAVRAARERLFSEDVRLDLDGFRENSFDSMLSTDSLTAPTLTER